MNLYLRYFDKETLVTNVDDALDFLRSIQEIGMNETLKLMLENMPIAMSITPKDTK